MNTPERYEHYKLISKVIRTALTANLDLALVATIEDNSPSVTVEKGLCKIYDDSRNRAWDYTCSIVNLEGLVPSVYTKPVYPKPEDINITNPIVNALLDDMGVVGCIRYGSGSLIPIAFIVREDTYPADMYMIINVLNKQGPQTSAQSPARGIDTIVEPSCDVIAEPTLASNSTDVTKAESNRYWRGMTLGEVTWCLNIIESFFGTKNGEYKSIIHYAGSDHPRGDPPPPHVFTHPVVAAIGFVYRYMHTEPSLTCTSMETRLRFINRTAVGVMITNNKELYHSCQIISDLLTDMYTFLRTIKRY